MQTGSEWRKNIQQGNPIAFAPVPGNIESRFVDYSWHFGATVVLFLIEFCLLFSLAYEKETYNADEIINR